MNFNLEQGNKLKQTLPPPPPPPPPPPHPPQKNGKFQTSHLAKPPPEVGKILRSP